MTIYDDKRLLLKLSSIISMFDVESPMERGRFFNARLIILQVTSRYSSLYFRGIEALRNHMWVTSYYEKIMKVILTILLNGSTG